MSRVRRRAFTLLEILVAVAILVILMAFIFRPLLMGVEVLSIGRAEREAQAAAQNATDTIKAEMSRAYKVYSNLTNVDLMTVGNTGQAGRWRTPQTGKISLVPAAVDANGRALTPVQPATNPQGWPQVVTYWVARQNLTLPYDPLNNPRRLFRAVSYYEPYREPIGTSTLTVNTPDDVYGFAVRRAQLLGGTLSDSGPVLFPLLFAQGRPLDFQVANIDRTFAGPPATDAEKIMRSPEPQAAGAPDAYTHAAAMLGISTVTEAGADIRELSLLPYRIDSEQLTPNRDFTAYSGSLNRWQAPYQRGSDGLWTAPSTGLVTTGSGPLPLVGMFRVQDVRDGAGPLALNYFLSVDADPTSPTVGHLLVYRMPDNPGDPTVPVYDVADWPRRVFGAAPGALGGTAPFIYSGEFACGVDFETGQILTTFPQEDVICPAGDMVGARLLALNNFDHRDSLKPTPPYFGGSPGVDQIWQSLPLTTATDFAGNGGQVDNHYLIGAQNVWTSYTLSAFRPERLQTGTLAGLNLTQRQLNMSIVPGSMRVVVEKRDAGNLNGPPLASRAYQVVESSAPGAPPALRPYQCYADPSSGKLVFYDPQLAGDALVASDGYNPPIDLAGEQINGQAVRTVIVVNYEYRNNLPTVAQLLAGNDANRDVVEMTYRSLQSWMYNLTLDVPSDSTHGETEVIGDPADASASTSERPTGARRRVSVQQRMNVGSR